MFHKYDHDDNITSKKIQHGSEDRYSSSHFRGAGKSTHIMYRTNLSWAACQNFIKSLEELGLVSPSYVRAEKIMYLLRKGPELWKLMQMYWGELDPLN